MNLTPIRVLFYALSPVLTAIAPMLMGWGIAYENGVISIEVEALLITLGTALGASGGVFKIWGKK